MKKPHKEKFRVIKGDQTEEEDHKELALCEQFVNPSYESKILATPHPLVSEIG